MSHTKTLDKMTTRNNNYEPLVSNVTEHASTLVSDPHVTAAYRQFVHRLTMKYRICEEPEDKSIQEIGALMGMIPGGDLLIYYFRRYMQLNLQCER